MSITKEQFFSEVWTILVTHAGAYNGAHQRSLFVTSQCERRVDAYRFGGVLGFGGNLRRERGVCYVTTPPAEVAQQPKMRAVIDDVNQRLTALLAAHPEAAEWL